MNRVFLLLGGNLGDRFGFLFSGIEKISQRIGTLSLSSGFFHSKAWGKSDQPDFINCALLVETEKDIFEVFTRIQEIENEAQNPPKEKWGPRNLDIDLLLFNRESIATEKLTVPHPFLKDRKFVLEPLCEIAPTEILGNENLPLSYWLSVCPDPLTVTRL